MEGGGQAALGALQAELGEVATGSAAARVLARGLADFAGTEAPQSLCSTRCSLRSTAR